MIFSNREIELAQQIKGLGIPWTPSVGNYVYDVSGVLGASTPFQPHVHFIVDLHCFVDRLGDIDNVKRLLVWLPTWYDARHVLRELGMEEEDVELELVRRSAIARADELSAIYEIIAQQLSDARLQAIYQRL